jgi:hypothetical protein
LKDICIIQEDNGLPPVVITGDIDGWETRLYFKYSGSNEWTRNKFADNMIILDNNDISFTYLITTFKDNIKKDDTILLRICIADDRNPITEDHKLIFKQVRECKIKVKSVKRFLISKMFLEWQEKVYGRIVSYRDLTNEDL